MLDAESPVIAFGPFRLFPTERRLERDGAPVPLGGRALDLLVYLVERAGEVVPNRDLMQAVWRDVNVEETSLRFHIKNLRKMLGEPRPDVQYITNVPGRGYCFAAPVDPLDRASASKPHGAPLGMRANLPERTGAIIGRSASIEIVSRELTQRRLVTIAGPAGIGKTTLAIATAAALRRSFDDAVFFVDLAPIEEPALVFSAFSSVLGGVGQAEDSVAALTDRLRGQRFLVVLDNCEQFVEAVARLADRIVRSVPGAHVLATSRETLQIAGERVHRLMPLEYPPKTPNISAGDALAYPAVQLFVDRATAAVDDFTLDDATAPAVAEICRRLDGIPFALELAAARVEFFGVFALASGLNDMFALLTKGRRFALPRHRTLRATLDWGYRLITPIEQSVLRRLSIFRAQFTLDAALAVAAGPRLPSEDAADAMANLVAKSLLTADATGAAVQYRLLEATRLYATEKLAESEEGLETARLHAEYNLKLFESAPNDWGSEVGKTWLRLYASRIDDVRAALDWSFSPHGDQSTGVELVLASARLWFQMFLNFEYAERLERTLRLVSEQSAPDPVTEMRLQSTLGHVCWYTLNKPDRAASAFTRALELADEVGDAQARLQGLWGVWAVRRARGQYREALQLATKYADVAETVGDPAFMLLGDRILGLTHHFFGDQRTAQALLERVRTTARQFANPPNTDFQLDPEVATTTMLVRILWLRGLPDQAAATLQEGIEAARRTNHPYSMSYVLGVAGCALSAWVGNLDETRRYLQVMTENAVNNPTLNQWRQCWQLILRLREGDEREALIAAHIEPRVDVSTFVGISALASASEIPLPEPDDDVGDALWCLPEALRVDAELLLWRDGLDAAAAAETRLLRSIETAREQSALSWELRATTSLARLWGKRGFEADARELLAATYDRFTEGFDSADLSNARRLLEKLS